MPAKTASWRGRLVERHRAASTKEIRQVAIPMTAGGGFASRPREKSPILLATAARRACGAMLSAQLGGVASRILASTKARHRQKPGPSLPASRARRREYAALGTAALKAASLPCASVSWLSEALPSRAVLCSSCASESGTNTYQFMPSAVRAFCLRTWQYRRNHGDISSTAASSSSAAHHVICNLL